MIEKKPPHAEGTHTTTTSREVGATGTGAHGTHTTVSGAEVKAPKVESDHTKETADPAEDPDIQNTVA